MVVWSGEVYKKAGAVEKQFMEVEFENIIRRFVRSNDVIIVRNIPGDQGCSSFVKVPLAFSKLYDGSGNDYSLHRTQDGNIHAIHKSTEFFLGSVLGASIRFYDGSDKTLEGFMRYFEK